MFMRFLKDRNRYSEFIANCKGGMSKKYKDINDYLKSIGAYHVLPYAFLWKERYWADLNEDWRKILDERFTRTMEITLNGKKIELQIPIVEEEYGEI